MRIQGSTSHSGALVLDIVQWPDQVSDTLTAHPDSKFVEITLAMVPASLPAQGKLNLDDSNFHGLTRSDTEPNRRSNSSQ